MAGCARYLPTARCDYSDDIILFAEDPKLQRQYNGADMPIWIINILAAIYTRIPRDFRPPLKSAFYWILIRIQAIAKRRPIHKGQRVTFVDFEVADLELFEFLGPGPDEILVEALNSTVSPGTERAVLCGLPGARRTFPYLPGYSTAGRVTAVGKRVRKISVGDRVAGRIHHMSHETVRSDSLFNVPDNVSDLEASFIELGIITLQGVRKARLEPGDRVAVVGQGLIGQMANRIVRLLGVVEVIAVASSARRANTALVPGGANNFFSLDQCLDPSTIQADVVIEAVGTPDAVELAMRCARDQGRVVLLGSSRGISREVDYLKAAQLRDLEVVGAHISAIPSHDPSPGMWTYRQEGELFLNLLASKKLSVKELLTWLAHPGESNAVYEKLASGGGAEVAIVFDWKARMPEKAAIETSDSMKLAMR